MSYRSSRSFWMSFLRKFENLGAIETPTTIFIFLD
jgi:hypothetical protein